MRESARGQLGFEFRFSGTGRIDVLGVPLKGEAGDVYRKSGGYRLEDGNIVTPALNEGQPVRIRLRRDKLLLEINERLSFVLHQQ